MAAASRRKPESFSPSCETEGVEGHSELISQEEYARPRTRQGRALSRTTVLSSTTMEKRSVSAKRKPRFPQTPKSGHFSHKRGSSGRTPTRAEAGGGNYDPSERSESKKRRCPACMASIEKHPRK